MEITMSCKLLCCRPLHNTIPQLGSFLFKIVKHFKMNNIVIDMYVHDDVERKCPDTKLDHFRLLSDEKVRQLITIAYQLKTRWSVL